VGMSMKKASSVVRTPIVLNTNRQLNVRVI
jgi:hypothetical protein